MIRYVDNWLPTTVRANTYSISSRIFLFFRNFIETIYRFLSTRVYEYELNDRYLFIYLYVLLDEKKKREIQVRKTIRK